MEKIVFNAPLNHKANGYELMQIEVEKVISLNRERFEQLRDHPLEDFPEIAENKDLMYIEGDTAHCILFRNANGLDGILVESEGCDYARKSQYIPNAFDIVELNDITMGECQLHANLKALTQQIVEQAKNGQRTFELEKMLDTPEIRATLVMAVSEMLMFNSTLIEMEEDSNKMEEFLDHVISVHPAHEMKLYCPLMIQAEPQTSETDWDDYEVIPPSCACGCENKINKAIMQYASEKECLRGLMIYYDEDSPVNEKVFAAFPSVEVRNGELVGVLTCQLTEPLTDSEMAEFQDWWSGQASDGWGEGFEQREIKTDAFGTIYVSFWNSSDSWQIEAEMTDTADVEEEENLDMGGISM